MSKTRKKRTKAQKIKLVSRVAKLMTKGIANDDACSKVGIYNSQFYKWRKLQADTETKVIIYKPKNTPKSYKKRATETMVPLSEVVKLIVKELR